MVGAFQFVPKHDMWYVGTEKSTNLALRNYWMTPYGNHSSENFIYDKKKAATAGQQFFKWTQVVPSKYRFVWKFI